MKFKTEYGISWHHTWDRIDNTTDPGWFVKFLDASRLRQLEFIKRDPSEYFSFLNIKHDMHILDLGCGTGILLHPLAELVGKNGRVVGVDVSDFMIREARKRAGLTDLPLEFYKGNVYKLDFPENTFDRATSSSLFQHLKRPDEAINEIKRVVKPGGLISVFDYDWDSLFINSSLNNITRSISDFYRQSLKNCTAGKYLAETFRNNNLKITGEYKIFLKLDYDEFLSSNIGFYQASQLCVDEGLISADEKQMWLSDLNKKNEHGDFRFEFTGYRVVGMKI